MNFNEISIFLFSLVAVSNFSMLASSRLSGCIKLLALQGFLISTIPLLHDTSLKGLIWCVVILSIKALIFPYTLDRAVKLVGAKREVEPIIGYTASCVIALILLIFSFCFSSKMKNYFPELPHIQIMFSAFTILCGLFMIIARIKAITQVIGYIVFENGIYLFGIALAIEQNLITELGVILDLLAFVLLSGIIIFHINREFDHIDTHFAEPDSSSRGKL